MKTKLHAVSKLFWMVTILLASNIFMATAQENRYIDMENPVVENISPSRDGMENYHFYYTFNWITDLTDYSSQSHPKIQRIIFYKFGAKDPFYAQDASNHDLENQAEFIVAKSRIDDHDLIQYEVKWEIQSASGQTLSNTTKRKTIRINFDADPELLVEVSTDRIFYTDNLQHPRIRIKTNRDGTTIEELTLRMAQEPNSIIIAEVEDETRINSNAYTELIFRPTGVAPLQESDYYLYGRFRNGTLSQNVPVLREDNTYKPYKKQEVTIKELNDVGKVITVNGHSDKKIVLDATGDALDVKASLQLGNHGNRGYQLKDVGNQRWELTIPGEEEIPFGTFNLVFTGTGANGEPMKSSTFSYVKKPVVRKVLQMEYEDKEQVYKVTAEFNEETSGKVYLVIDNMDVQMTKSPSDPKIYTTSFSFNDNVMQSISEIIKRQPNSQKRIFLTTKIDGIADESLLAQKAMLINTEELENKKKKDIRKYLDERGFEGDEIKSLTNKIASELKKNKNERNWKANVWSSVVELAPKAFPLVMMLL